MNIKLQLKLGHLAGYQTLECFIATPKLGLNPSLTVLSFLMWQYVALSFLNVSVKLDSHVGVGAWISQIMQAIALYCHLHIIYK